MNGALSKYFQIVKDNLALIAIIPTTLGGIWQLFKLGSISISMIRFFSLSQLVIDGLIIILFLVFPFLFFIGFFSKNTMKEFYSEENFKPKEFFNQEGMLTRFGFYAIFIAVAIADYADIMNFRSLYSYLMLMVVFTILIITFFVFSFNILRKNTLIEVYFILSTVICVMVSISALNNNYQKTDNIANVNDMINKIEKNKSYSKKPRVLYFNDKYIFIEIIEKNKEQILIKKIDDLF